jgi:hypothetical protein
MSPMYLSRLHPLSDRGGSYQLYAFQSTPRRAVDRPPSWVLPRPLNATRVNPEAQASPFGAERRRFA